jgi:predicted  nucleic acid-binding Zn-ribbon protein
MATPSQDYHKELSNMDARLTEMEEKIDAIDKKLTQVVDAILGNPLTKIGGFVHDIEILKDRIEKLEKQQVIYEDLKKKAVWTLGVVLALGGLVQYITNIYLNFKK